MSVGESQMSANELKIFSLIPVKYTHGPVCYCCNYAKVKETECVSMNCNKPQWVQISLNESK